ncbi:hypothetical protein KCV06_g281, partial [Aureobasidium melanogenum]
MPDNVVGTRSVACWSCAAAEQSQMSCFTQLGWGAWRPLRKPIRQKDRADRADGTKSKWQQLCLDGRDRNKGGLCRRMLGVGWHVKKKMGQLLREPRALIDEQYKYPGLDR